MDRFFSEVEYQNNKYYRVYKGLVLDLFMYRHYFELFKQLT